MKLLQLVWVCVGLPQIVRLALDKRRKAISSLVGRRFLRVSLADNGTCSKRHFLACKQRCGRVRCWRVLSSLALALVSAEQSWAPARRQQTRSARVPRNGRAPIRQRALLLCEFWGRAKSPNTERPMECVWDRFGQ
ncbi:uncharacterized protein CC84DRAFT_53409 [Paraphaeosphaeria sporulosa]|uniref:Secreted protein n=1 Tax=Paraphaeosphaeria sporulosa TaxID=1460663 RepID=A0A177CW66_9PLEO|nr:uncharacterized protein CC84DRAFT_53409 [Paraphaeosphaeria sporulosa]OAG11795.1 hypothetical protein CC84DRAFT_53409 [Paraphaeosphaeria sporulosa]